MPVVQPINPALLKALRTDDAEEFGRVMREERWCWPRNSPTSDYDLLMKAIRLGRKRITNLLLEQGTEVNKNGRKTSPLHQAVLLIGWGGVIEKLLKLGARVGIKNTRGDTVLHAAFRCGAPQLVMEMLFKAYAKESRIDKRNCDGLSFLHIASTHNKSVYLREFLDKYKTDINAQFSMICKYDDGLAYAGWSALHFAVAYGRCENAKILLENGANVHVKDANNSTPIHLAAERCNSKMIDLLLSYDVSKENVVNAKGLNHFMAACAGRNLSVVEQFLNVAESKNLGSWLSLINSRVQDDPSYQTSGFTALHFAAECGQLEIVQRLVHLGANPCALTRSNQTPFLLALGKQQFNVCLYLHENCPGAVDEALFANVFENTGQPPVTSVNVNVNEQQASDMFKREIEPLFSGNEVTQFVETDDFLDVAR